jgi:hypothetical protein
MKYICIRNGKSFLSSHLSIHLSVCSCSYLHHHLKVRLCVCVCELFIRVIMEDTWHGQYKCGIGHDEFDIDNDFDDENLVPTYVSDGGRGLSQTCLHLNHYSCVKEWYDKKTKEQEAVWITQMTLDFGDEDEEDFRESWNAGLIPTEYNKDYEDKVERVPCPGWDTHPGIS